MPTFELDTGMGNCTGPVSATLFIYLRYLGDNPNSSLLKLVKKGNNGVRFGIYTVHFDWK
jgi:hypothetical protein